MALQNTHGEIFVEYAVTPRAHTRYLPLMMDAVLAQARVSKLSLSHIAFANGPGAFTGVRIAASTAQGISIGLGCPLVAISTLAVLAQTAADQYAHTDILAAIDARMGEAYVGRYRQNEADCVVRAVADEQLLKLADLATPTDCFLAGSGFSARRAAGLAMTENDRIDDALLPHAAALVKLARVAVDEGRCDPVGSASINYLRNQVAEKSRKKSL